MFLPSATLCLASKTVGAAIELRVLLLKLRALLRDTDRFERVALRTRKMPDPPSISSIIRCGVALPAISLRAQARMAAAQAGIDFEEIHPIREIEHRTSKHTKAPARHGWGFCSVYIPQRENSGGGGPLSITKWPGDVGFATLVSGQPHIGC
jgi:hypothetical protein